MMTQSVKNVFQVLTPLNQGATQAAQLNVTRATATNSQVPQAATQASPPAATEQVPPPKAKQRAPMQPDERPSSSAEKASDATLTSLQALAPGNAPVAARSSAETRYSTASATGAEDTNSQKKEQTIKRDAASSLAFNVDMPDAPGRSGVSNFGFDADSGARPGHHGA